MEKAELSPKECEHICTMCEEILKIIGYAQGREASYELRREEFKIIQFPSEKQEPSKEDNEKCRTVRKR